MTSTSSAAVTGLLSRRDLIAQSGMLAGTMAVGATAFATPVLAGDPGPIERMYQEHVRLAEIYEAAFMAEWEAKERYVDPERPRWSPWTNEGGYKLEPLPNNKCRCYLDDGDENIAKLKDIIAKPYVFDPEFIDTEQSDQVRVERAKETLAHIEAWKAEAQRRSDEAGLTVASKAKADAEAAASAHAVQVFAIEPTTFRELAFRAAVLLHTFDEEVAEMLPEQLVELAGVDPRPPYI